MLSSAEVLRAIAVLEAHREALGPDVCALAVAALKAALSGGLDVATASRGEAGEQRKQVTVLFADVSGFTAMSERMDPEEVREVMNEVWSRVDRAITDRGGRIDKHIGDAVMALFGADVAREDDAERAVRAALDMQAALRAISRELRLPKPLAMRIGVHTGPVVLGIVGSAGEYTAMGDSVNLASRLEHAAPVEGILISHDTYRHVRGVFEVRAQDPLHVKGKSDPIQTYVVVSAKTKPVRMIGRAVEGIETPLVGRDGELDALKSALRHILEKRTSRACLVTGEAGVGKSRLVWGFNAWVDLLPDHLRLFRGRVTQETGGNPYALIKDLFAERFEMQESDPPEVARKKLVDGVRGFLASEGEEAAHFIGHLIGLDFADTPTLRGIRDDAKQIRDRAVYHLGRLFRAVAEELPAVLLFEDIHWADDGSLDVLEQLIDAVHDRPILLIFLARPLLKERRERWWSGELQSRLSVERIPLSPLNREGSRALVEAILQRVENLPAELKDRIVSAGEGNPYYLEELIKMLIEDGVIQKGEERWTVAEGRLALLKVPSTLTAVLQARLDALGPDERRVLQRAAVIGRMFWDDAVRHLEDDDADLGRVLKVLEDRELVFKRKESAFAGSGEYAFRHALLRDVTYERALLKQRRRWHERAAQWIIERVGSRSGAYALRIAEHWEQAGNEAQAGEWLAKAARQAHHTYSLDEATRLYRRAMELFPSRLDLYEGLGEVLRWQGKTLEAIEVFDAMRMMAEVSLDKQAQARAWIGMTYIYELLGRHRTGLEMARRAAGIARAAGAGPLLVNALLRQGSCSVRLGDLEQGQAIGKEALTLAEELSHLTGKGTAHYVLGLCAVSLGHTDEAMKEYQVAHDVFAQLGDGNMVARMLNAQGEVARFRGDFEAALPLYERAHEAYLRVGDRLWALLVRSNMGGAKVGRGDGQGAVDTLTAVVAEAPRGWFVLPESLRFLAEAHLALGNLDEALVTAQQALSTAEAAEMPDSIAPAWRVLGEIAARKRAPIRIVASDGDLALGPAECFARSLKVIKVAKLEAERPQTLRSWALAELDDAPGAVGDREKGAKLWSEALEMFAKIGADLEVKRMRDARVVEPER